MQKATLSLEHRSSKCRHTHSHRRQSHADLATLLFCTVQMGSTWGTVPSCLFLPLPVTSLYLFVSDSLRWVGVGSSVFLCWGGGGECNTFWELITHKDRVLWLIPVLCKFQSYTCFKNSLLFLLSFFPLSSEFTVSWFCWTWGWKQGGVGEKCALWMAVGWLENIEKFHSDICVLVWGLIFFQIWILPSFYLVYKRNYESICISLVNIT